MEINNTFQFEKMENL